MPSYQQTSPICLNALAKKANSTQRATSIIKGPNATQWHAAQRKLPLAHHTQYLIEESSLKLNCSEQVQYQKTCVGEYTDKSPTALKSSG